MNIEVKKTNDGSFTLYVEALDETYHSCHGALQEAIHVFIENGLKSIAKKEINIFELGFGTGMNAILSYQATECHDLNINYTGIEAYPLNVELIEQLNYKHWIDIDAISVFDKMHQCEWNKSEKLSEKFTFLKIAQKIQDFQLENEKYDLIYFDAFGHRAQQEMWDFDLIEKLSKSLKKEGVLVSYCARGQFKRDLKQLGFLVESLPGPPGKREMTRAVKI